MCIWWDKSLYNIGHTDNIVSSLIKFPFKSFFLNSIRFSINHNLKGVSRRQQEFKEWSESKDGKDF